MLSDFPSTSLETWVVVSAVALNKEVISLLLLLLEKVKLDSANVLVKSREQN